MFERVIIQNDSDAINAQEWHGPFDTREEAAKAAEIGIAGEGCKLILQPVPWDPAWDKAQ
jgi:hypothetical protein